jgi:iron complex outermembrane receptor protein
VLGLFYNGNWGLPGGQTAAQRDEDRTLAIPYSVENNTSVWRNRAMGGLSHTYYGENKVIWRTSINGYGTEKTNPYGTSAFRNGFKTESAAGGGMRTDWTKRFGTDYQSTRLTVGAETQLEHYFIEETKNNFGQPGDFKYMYNVNYANVNVFALVDVNVRERWKFQVGTSVMREQQHVSGYTADDWATDTTSVSEWQVLPRVAVSYYLTPRMQWYGSLGVGNSMPNVFEMIDYENNRYNLDLQPEQGLNRELGLKWGDPSREMSFEVNYYYTNIRRIILSETALVADPGNPNAQIEVDQFVPWIIGTVLTMGL